jgi:hypothetical protein
MIIDAGPASAGNVTERLKRLVERRSLGIYDLRRGVLRLIRIVTFHNPSQSRCALKSEESIAGPT